MRKVLVLVVPLVALLGTGCASQWSKPGALPGEFERDRYDCMQEAQQVFVSGVYRYGGMRTNKLLYHQCMEARGWRDHTNKHLREHMWF
jgi:hypothetical protein